MKPYHNYQLLPNKHDSFDTKVSETIVLFLFAKAPVTQGFSAQLPFGFVSLWAARCNYSLCRTADLSSNENHAEAFLRGIVSAWLQKIHDGRKSFSANNGFTETQPFRTEAWHAGLMLICTSPAFLQSDSLMGTSKNCPFGFWTDLLP